MFLTIPGKPQGKARHRTNSITGVTYTPKQTKKAEELIQWLFRLNYPGFEPLTGPVSATITAYFPIPKSWSKAKRTAAVYPLVKPDGDNIAKLVFDALNGLAYLDDKQIARQTIIKKYGEPRVEVTVEPLTNNE